MTETKKCSKCNELKKINLFPKPSPSAIKKYKGATGGTICKSCKAKYKLEKYPPERRMFWNSRCRARYNSLPFTIKQEDILIPEKCPITDLTLEVSTSGKGNHNSPSLVMVDPRLGYTPGNIKVVSWKAMCWKRNATPDELRRIYEYMKEWIKD